MRRPAQSLPGRRVLITGELAWRVAKRSGDKTGGIVAKVIDLLEYRNGHGLPGWAVLLLPGLLT